MSAKEMFDKLGYEKIQDDVNWLIYSLQNFFNICFYKPQQDIEFGGLDFVYKTIDVDELQAINQQVKELGWLDERK